MLALRPLAPSRNLAESLSAHGPRLRWCLPGKRRFFGLGTGYLIYGPEELFKLPGRNRAVDLTTGLWGIFMPGLMQLITGTYLFVGLTWFTRSGRSRSTWRRARSAAIRVRTASCRSRSR
jgi:hypothetical protein